MIKEIKYSGFTATPSDYECPDGELDAAINLVPEEGELHPVQEGEVLIQMPVNGTDGGGNEGEHIKYKVAFVHSNSTYYHLIIVKETHQEGSDNYVSQLYWLNAQVGLTMSEALKTANMNNLSAIPHTYTCTGEGLSVSGIGNTLVVTGATNGVVHYVLWKDSAYKYLGNHIPEIYLSFSLRGEVKWKLPSGGFGFDNGYLHIMSGEQYGSEHYQIIHYAASRVSDSIMGLVNKSTKELKDEGYFVHPFFVRYALRLYDGTLTMHSAPILMNPCTTCSPFVYSPSATEAYVNVVAMYVAADLECKFLNLISDDSALADWEDIITGVDIFVTNQICPYDQDGQITGVLSTSIASQPDTTNTGHSGTSSGLGGSRSGGTSSSVSPRGQGIRNAIVDSVFIGSFDGEHYAQYRYPHIYGWYPRPADSPANNTYGSDTAGGTDIGGGAWPAYSFGLPMRTAEQIKDDIENESRFYFLKSIRLDELSEYTTRKKVEFSVTKVTDNISGGSRGNATYESSLTSLLGNEVMTDDYHSHDNIMPNAVYEYNNRLNFAGIRRVLFNGFPLSSMLAFCNTRYSYQVLEGSAGGRTGSTTHGEFVYSPYEFQNYSGYDKYSVEVYLKIDGEEKKVVCNLDNYCESLQNILSNMDDNDEYQGDSWGVYFFYPDPNAYKMRIIHRGSDDLSGLRYNSGDYFDVVMERHDFLTGAFAFLDYNIVRQKTGSTNISDSTTVVVNELSKIYTSDANNPFVFATTNINTIGTGSILSLATVTKALSQGQFGQFPLYAFTTDGVWALEVAGDGTFSAKHPVTRDVCTNKDSITQLDNSVIFTTDRGIMLLSGSDTICITDSIYSEDEYRLITGDDNTDLLPQLDNLLTAMDDDNNLKYPSITTATDIVPFKTFLPKARMLYDYTHQRIIVYNPERDYAYIYSLKSKQWGMMASSIQYAINSYPECLAVDAQNRIIDMSAITDSDSTAITDSDMSAITNNNSTRNCLLITRPLKLDAPDILKTIDTIIQRGKFRKGSVKSILYGSRDLYNWHLVYSSTDHYLRGFRGTPYKFFRIVLLCDIKKDESLFGATIQYNNRLIDQPR